MATTFQAHKNFAYSTLTAGISNVDTAVPILAGTTTRFPTAPFNAVICPFGQIPTPDNSEVVRVTAINAGTNTLTVTRAVEPEATAKAFLTGAQIFAAITADTIEALEGAINTAENAVDTLNTNVSSLTTTVGTKANTASPTFTGTVTTPALNISGQTASRAAVFDASKNVISSAVTATELGYLTGLKRAIQTQQEEVVINPRDYGCVCDYYTVENDANVQAALTAWRAKRGATLLIPAPGMRVAQPIVIKREDFAENNAPDQGVMHRTIRGATRNVTLRFHPSPLDGSGSFIRVGDDAGGNPNRNVSLVLENINIEGPGKTTGSWIGVHHTATTDDIIWRNVLITSWSNIGALVKEKTPIVFDNIRFMSNNTGLSSDIQMDAGLFQLRTQNNNTDFTSGTAGSGATPIVHVVSNPALNGHIFGGNCQAGSFSGYGESNKNQYVQLGSAAGGGSLNGFTVRNFSCKNPESAECIVKLYSISTNIVLENVIDYGTVTLGSVWTVTVSNGGSGYVVGDFVTIVEGGNTTARFRVASVTGGAVTTIDFTGGSAARGSGYTVGNDRTTTAYTGVGTGCIVNVTFVGKYYPLVLSGSAGADSSSVAILSCKGVNDQLFKFSTGEVISGTYGTQAYVNCAMDFYAAAGKNVKKVSIDGTNGIRVDKSGTITTGLTGNFAVIDASGTGRQLEFNNGVLTLGNTNGQNFNPTLTTVNATTLTVSGTSTFTGASTFNGAVSCNSSLTAATDITLTAPTFANMNHAITKQYLVNVQNSNLVPNGTGLFLNNYNWPVSITFDGTDVPATGGIIGSFRINSSNGTSSAELTDYIPVNRSLSYDFSVWAKTLTDITTTYIGFKEYDQDKLYIYSDFYRKASSSTDTELYEALAIGATTVKIKNGTGWTNNNRRYQHFAWWYHEPSTTFTYRCANGLIFQPYTYTRTTSWQVNQATYGQGTGAYPAGSGGTYLTVTDQTTYWELALAAPWPGPALPVDTPVRNCVGNESSAGTKYALKNGGTTSTSWVQYATRLGNIVTSVSAGSDINKFTPGTFYIRPMFAITETSANNKMWVAGWTIKEAAPSLRGYALIAQASSVNIDFTNSADYLLTLSASTGVTFVAVNTPLTASANFSDVTIHIVNNYAGSVNITPPTGTKAIGTAFPASIASGKRGVMKLRSEAGGTISGTFQVEV